MSLSIQPHAETSRWWKHPKVILFAVMVVIPCAVGIPVAIAQQNAKPVTNPKVGWVQTFKDSDGSAIYKRCDGSTMLYKYVGRSANVDIVAVPASSECTT